MSDSPTSSERLTKVGHAVNLLNNHLPVFGGKYLGAEPWSSDGDDRLMDHVPERVRVPLTAALENAAKFLAREFGDVFPAE